MQNATSNTENVFPLETETDLGNAHRLKRLHGQRLRYCKPWRCWLWYDGIRWRRDDTGAAQRAAQETARSIYQEAAESQDLEKRKVLGRWALASQSDRSLRAMLHQAEALLPILPEQLDAHPLLLNCLNVTVDLETGQTHDHEPSDYLMALAPVQYDRDAHYSLWDRFLDEVTCNDRELRAYLQRALGYSISGEVTEKVLFFGYGDRDSGKTTLLESLKAALGDYALTINFNAFLRHKSGGDAANPTVANLKGRRFVGSSEVEEGAALAVSLVKNVVGGDTLTARRLHENPFIFKPTHKLWLMANHTPKVPTDDNAIWARIKRIPFKMQLQEVDPTVKKRLTNPDIAGAAILAWLVEGYQAWRRQGFGSCAAVEKSTEEYRKENDQIEAFVQECCIESPEAKVSSAALWSAFARWIEKSKEPPGITRTKFGILLEKRGYKHATLGHAASRAWQGIRLVSTGADGLFPNADGLVNTVEPGQEGEKPLYADR